MPTNQLVVACKKLVKNYQACLQSFWRCSRVEIVCCVGSCCSQQVEREVVLRKSSVSLPIPSSERIRHRQSYLQCGTGMSRCRLTSAGYPCLLKVLRINGSREGWRRCCKVDSRQIRVCKVGPLVLRIENLNKRPMERHIMSGSQ